MRIPNCFFAGQGQGRAAKGKHSPFQGAMTQYLQKKSRRMRCERDAKQAITNDKSIVRQNIVFKSSK